MACARGEPRPRDVAYGSFGRASVRTAVLALRRSQDKVSAESSARQLQAALVLAEKNGDAFDSALLGMAAAKASKYGMTSLLDTLCAFTWSRLNQYGGREVAELSAAAARSESSDSRFFSCVALYCFNNPGSFGCLRDVALMATALQLQANKHDGSLDLAIAFHGLTVAALAYLQAADSKLSPRDLADFFSSLAHTLHRSPLNGGPALCNMPVPVQVCSALAQLVRPLLHMASAQDLSKVADAAAISWPLLPLQQEQVLRPLLVELALATKYRWREFNAQDVMLTAVAFSKVDVLDDHAADALGEQVLEKLPAAKSKELCLLLWACTRSCGFARKAGGAACSELSQRDMSKFSAQDVCMAAQALAKIGAAGKAPLCFVMDEAFDRQLQGFSTAEKAMLLWSLAKSKVVHIALCRLLARDLATERTDCLPREVSSATLWALGALWQSVSSGEAWSFLLMEALLAAEPWCGALDYEVANALLAFSQLPALNLRPWLSILGACHQLKPENLSLHELCNIIVGLAACPPEASTAEPLLEVFATEVVDRNRSGDKLSPHEERLLARCLARRLRRRGSQTDTPAVQSLREAVTKSSTSTLEKQQEGASPLHKSPAASGGDGAAGPCAEVPPVSEQNQPRDGLDLLSSYGRGHGHGHGHGHVHGHGHGHSHSDDETGDKDDFRDAQESHGPRCSGSCCPEVNVTVGAVGQKDNLLRLNAHCGYRGHCIQLKHTFIHVECTNQSDDSDEDCMLCHLTRRRRARSLDFCRDSDGKVEAIQPYQEPSSPSRQEASRDSSASKRSKAHITAGETNTTFGDWQ